MKPVLQVFVLDFAAKVLVGAAGLLLIRFLPEAEYAVLSLALPFAAAVVQGVSTNLNGIYVVGYQKLKLDRSPQLLLALQLWLLTAVILVTLPFSAAFRGVFGIVIALIFSHGILEFIKTYLQHQLRFTAFGLLEAVRSVLFVVPLMVWLFAVGDRQQLKTWHVLSLQTASIVLVVIFSFGRNLNFRTLLRFPAILSLAKEILKSKFPFMIGYFFVLAFLTRIDVLMLKALDSDLQLATYGSAFRYYGLLMILMAAMHTVYLPLTQRFNNRKELGFLLMKHQRMIVVVFPLILLGAWLSRWIIPFIDGGKYPDACEVFRILSISAMISLACSPHANVLFRYEAFRFLFCVVIGAFAVNVALNLLLIPRYHASGAAWATLSSMGFLNGLTYAKSRALMASYPLPENSSTAVAAG